VQFVVLRLLCHNLPFEDMFEKYCQCKVAYWCATSSLYAL